MARTGAVWAIDIGNCGLKALRCHAHERADRIVADAFDYIEYPKILTQPGAEPRELVAEALQQFLSRNSVAGDAVAISVSGQAGLARFIKLPPVEAKQIPNIVRYEARQQIPFDLNDVIWDYQRMGGGAEEEGFALETEIGLFAMKRETVFRSLEPFQDAGIEVDYVQLSPLALYNYVYFDMLADELPPPEEYDPENPPGSVAVISMGTDATDLVITNGYRVWQRNIPLGGSHFTKALTKELKLTFAKAEHLKRNVSAAQDPKAVFRAMRPVFSDLLTELHRSINYFNSLDRAARIDRVIALGNSMKLPGLRKYLSENLGMEIETIGSFRGLTGSRVVSAPAFQENITSFAVCYGLALQGLDKAALKTNLLPREIIRDRLIRQKKPWAVGAAAVLLLGCFISFASYSLASRSVDEERWQAAESAAASAIQRSQDFKNGYEEALRQYAAYEEIGEHLTGNVEGRIVWMELLKALSECLPPYDRSEDIYKQQLALPVDQREFLYITGLQSEQVEDLGAWYDSVHQAEQEAGAEQGGPEAAAAEQTTPEASPEQAAERPSGPGTIIRLTGHHFHNRREFSPNLGAQYVRNTLIHHLRNGKVLLPSGPGGQQELVSMEELGIRYPVLVNPTRPYEYEMPDPQAPPAARAAPGSGAGRAGARAGREDRPMIKVERFDFVVEFVWTPTPPSVRHGLKQQAQGEQSLAAE